jgi:hypothetical protein
VNGTGPSPGESNEVLTKCDAERGEGKLTNNTKEVQAKSDAGNLSLGGTGNPEAESSKEQAQRHERESG